MTIQHAASEPLRVYKAGLRSTKAFVFPSVDLNQYRKRVLKVTPPLFRQPSGDSQMAEQQYLYRIKAEGQHDCRAEHVANHGCRQRRHQDALARKRAEQRDVEDGQRDQPGTRPRTPQMATLARDIEDRLAAVHQRNNRQRPQSVTIETEDKAPDRETSDTEGEIAKSQDDTGDGEIAHSPDIGRRRRPHVI